jgi:hypothetical protein
VTRFGREGAKKLIALLGEQAWLIQEHVKPAAPRKPVTEAKAETKPAKSETKAAAKPAKKTSQTLPRVEPPPEPVSRADEPLLEPVGNLDLDVLFDPNLQLDGDLSFDDVFGPDAPGVDVNNLHGDKLSFEEAQNMGLLGD